MRLIDADALKDAIKKELPAMSNWGEHFIPLLIDNAPTVCVGKQPTSEEAWVSNAEIFERVFGMYATELWTMSEADFLKWLNQEIPEFEKEGGAE